MAGRSVYVRADIKGIDKLLSKLSTADPIYAEPWRRALSTATDELRGAEQVAAPKQTGRLEAAMTGRLDASHRVPEWGIVSNEAENRGFRYGFALNARPLHFRTGPRKGQSTRGWFTKTFQKFGKRVSELLDNAAREIEAKWQS